MKEAARWQKKKERKKKKLHRKTEAIQKQHTVPSHSQVFGRERGN
jgi:hypothetical protein